jgi:hypothetical protein
MDNDHDAEWVRSIASRLRGLHEDQVISRAEASIESADPHLAVPGPNTAHPAIAGAADCVRSFNRHTVALPLMRRAGMVEPDEQFPAATFSDNKILVTRRKAFGPAPYVGEPFLYVWPVWMDDFGRHIAGDTERVPLA